MASDDKIDIVDKKSKKDKKSEKRDKEKKLSDSGGVVKDKKDKKKDKKDKEKLTKKLEAHLDAQAADATALVVVDSKPEDVKFDIEEIIQTAEDLVPFALPLADDKTSKKLLKLVKKAAKLKAIHRGVKECEKALKKSPIKTPASNITEVPGLVIIAGDISPMEVIMHFPILCEEHNVPYFFVKSRAELGIAASTKRATSVVMLKPEGKKDTKGGKSDAEDGKVNPEEYLTAYKELVKISQKEWDAQVHPFVKGIHPLQIQAKSRA